MCGAFFWTTMIVFVVFPEIAGGGGGVKKRRPRGGVAHFFHLVSEVVDYFITLTALVVPSV